MRTFFLLSIVILSGCVVHSYPAPHTTTVVQTSPPVEPAPVVIYEPPPLVRIERTNIEWYAYPSYDIYYTDGYYYVYKDGIWYRSATYRGPWVRITVLPEVFWEIPPAHPRHTVIIKHTPQRRGQPPHARPGEGRETHPRRIER
ncbi:MAG: hypothetical protein N2234_08465 [Planctomycetota bacterium]|nr:hypothetical protein [Planctomycetota bacterium]